jgi:ribosome-binding protein aMBF1 (putative translation factor)
MAKYSTGDGGGGAGGSCELCGAEGVDLRTADVAGAKLAVCGDCAGAHGEGTTQSSGGRSDRDGESRAKRAAQNTARIHDAASNDPGHWEDGADYDDDQLPYLVRDYGDRLTAARQDAGYQIDELADELGLDADDVLAVEQGRATKAGVGGSTVAALEAFLDVELAETA